MFITNIIANHHENSKTQEFRAIVRKYQREPFVFTEGEELLHELSLITTDSVHPSLEGQALIARRWGKIIAQYLHTETRF